ncbi:MAG: hypothetical protein HOG03_16400 [Desulfobacula sp.]|jgi:hypothetical protein|uniref:hypothetical protein n=1 Tax=Desulfobacula sp. TaxID=2593537 RepID=UPI001EC5DA01|nr:hypothetical protein [Desulfobacula sp.]MBT4968576.1 hypothetical protein [Bacteroidota bacterium]MBT5546521.1 hypothetical protein [Desulfobacula sp.]MBT6750763.1 hypothetical protein [Desulfobacula sp.]MBT7087634.1 hypothetical protein [bacterium]
MTAQISDTFIYKKNTYSMIGKMGGDLFSPFKYSMIPEMLSTACYQGYYSTYEIKDEKLYLQRLTIRDKNGNYPPINGIDPGKQEFEANYKDLNLIIPFDGKLRLAKGFINDFYIHMGFQKASAFKKILDITFEDGRVTEVLDRSKEAKVQRGAFKKKYDSNEDWNESILEAFSLDMDFK